jgi:hypothetical protein
LTTIAVKRSPTREFLLDKSSLRRTRKLVPSGTIVGPRLRRRAPVRCGAACADQSVVNDGRLLMTMAAASESNVNRIETLFIVLLLSGWTLPELLIESIESENNAALQS